MNVRNATDVPVALADFAIARMLDAGRRMTRTVQLVYCYEVSERESSEMWHNEPYWISDRVSCWRSCIALNSSEGMEDDK